MRDALKTEGVAPTMSENRMMPNAPDPSARFFGKKENNFTKDSDTIVML
jgi:hypothetical protein